METWCKDCEDRHPGCHGKCEKYAEFKQWREERKKQIEAEKTKMRLLLWRKK